MKILFDTSVLVPCLTDRHPMNAIASPWLEKAVAGDFELIACNHSMAEVYSALTNLPIQPRIAPAEAQLLIQENLSRSAQFIELNWQDYEQAIRRVSENDFRGGVVYDSLLLVAARKARVDKILTFNIRDFTRLWPEDDDFIISP